LSRKWKGLLFCEQKRSKKNFIYWGLWHAPAKPGRTEGFGFAVGQAFFKKAALASP
jgi:hypothetical protein